MAMATMAVKVGQKPTKEQIKRIREAAKQPVNYTADCPQSTPKALAEFAAMARELRKNRRKARPSSRHVQDSLSKSAFNP